MRQVFGGRRRGVSILVGLIGSFVIEKSPNWPRREFVDGREPENQSVYLLLEE